MEDSKNAESKATDELSEDDVHKIKMDYYSGHGVGTIADFFGFTTAQVIHAINLDEDYPIKFTIADFEV